MNVVNDLVPQTDAPLLVVAGSQLAWRHGGAIELWDLARAKRVSSVPVEGAVAVGVHDGAPVAVAKAPKPRLVELITSKEVPAESVAAFSDPQRVYAAKDAVFVAQRGGLEIYKVKAKVELAKTLPWKRDEAKTFCGMGDAVYFHDGNAYQRVGADGASTAFASNDESPLHVAPGPRPDTLWTTTADELHLVTLAGGKATIAQRVKLAGIYHLASAGDAAAIVTIEMKAGAYSKVTVSAVGGDGHVRWTANVPLPKRTVGWVVASASHVALAFGDELHVWSAKDGAAISL